MVNQELGWGGSLSDEYPYRWDINSDASVVCYRSNFVEYTFFDLIVLSKKEQDNIIKEWSSIKEASLGLKIQSSDINNCCRGKNKTAGGYKFRYKI
jgi:hypothetical protein